MMTKYTILEELKNNKEPCDVYLQYFKSSFFTWRLSEKEEKWNHLRNVQNDYFFAHARPVVDRIWLKMSKGTSNIQRFK